MSQDYAREKFVTATSTLVGNGDIRTRLLGAYMSFHPIKESDFRTSELSKVYKEIMDRLTKITPKDSDEGRVPATVKQLSDDEAGEIAELIWNLTYSLLTAPRVDR
ncbi:MULTISPECIES: hypothetical protein [unclassified Mesorhizobium]|uniref:hypothetical protein n=1 Tax=unclassified Mesorhizobium TaxID=325217 RepID=UPI000FD32980|nr:hypothetical protein [Mesorhizobium sp. M6A.T.Cr.TU.017.01.1.1]RUU98362.1 hypothetical protein EOB36_23875 [Mesorhizobium sp. M6A.T.Cr.TU.017.01.1.1]